MAIRTGVRPDGHVLAPIMPWRAYAGLTKIDAAAITLELRFKAADAKGRDALRSKMLTSLPQRFDEAKIGSSGAELPAFS